MFNIITNSKQNTNREPGSIKKYRKKSFKCLLSISIPNNMDNDD